MRRRLWPRCVSEPLTLMSGSKGSGGGRAAHSSLSRSLSLSLFLARSLLSRSLSLCHTHTHTHTHTHRGTDWRKARELDTRAHTQQRGRCPEARTDPAWGLQPRRLQRMGGARAGVGWAALNLPRYSPDLGGEKVFPTLETKISSLFFLIRPEEKKGFS